MTSAAPSLTIAHMLQQTKINVAIDPALHAQLKALADKEQRKLQAVVERIVRAGLKAESKVKPS